MTPYEIQLVQSTFKQIIPIADEVANIFYQRLFELDPELKPLFKLDNITEQGRKLMTFLSTAINNLDNLETLMGPVEKLGRRHVGFGVKTTDYDTVGTALIWSLHQGLDKAFTPQVQEAWVATYNLLATVMKTAAIKAA